MSWRMRAMPRFRRTMSPKPKEPMTQRSAGRLAMPSSRTSRPAGDVDQLLDVLLDTVDVVPEDVEVTLKGRDAQPVGHPDGAWALSRLPPSRDIVELPAVR